MLNHTLRVCRCPHVPVWGRRWRDRWTRGRRWWSHPRGPEWRRSGAQTRPRTGPPPASPYATPAASMWNLRWHDCGNKSPAACILYILQFILLTMLHLTIRSKSLLILKLPKSIRPIHVWILPNKLLTFRWKKYTRSLDTCLLSYNGITLFRNTWKHNCILIVFLNLKVVSYVQECRANVPLPVTPDWARSRYL